jgi:hypothetical protein
MRPSTTAILPPLTSTCMPCCLTPAVPIAKGPGVLTLTGYHPTTPRARYHWYVVFMPLLRTPTATSWATRRTPISTATLTGMRTQLGTTPECMHGPSRVLQVNHAAPPSPTSVRYPYHCSPASHHRCRRRPRPRHPRLRPHQRRHPVRAALSWPCSAAACVLLPWDICQRNAS